MFSLNSLRIVRSERVYLICQVVDTPDVFSDRFFIRLLDTEQLGLEMQSVRRAAVKVMRFKRVPRSLGLKSRK